MGDGREMIEALRKQGYSGRSIGAACGVTQEHISRIRSGAMGCSKTLQIVLHLITTNDAIREHLGLHK